MQYFDLRGSIADEIKVSFSSMDACVEPQGWMDARVSLVYSTHTQRRHNNSASINDEKA